MKKEVGKEQVPSITIDEAAVKSITAILTNLEEFRFGKRSSFSVYFFIENELHKVEHEMFLAEIGARFYEDRPDVLITSSNVELYSIKQCFENNVVGYHYFDEESYTRCYPIISQSSL